MNNVLWYCRKCMGVRKEIRLKVSGKVTGPVVCGLLRPVILVPLNVGGRLGSRHLRGVLLHELAHIKRGDLWVNLAQTVLQIIYFYNLLLWLANAIIRRVRERAVDETVVLAMGEKARWYPETLVKVAKLTLRGPALGLRLIAVVESRKALAGRIDHVLNGPLSRRAKAGR
jgi:beta-lactamase regulating signal transducer with metallopeptidase domain